MTHDDAVAPLDLQLAGVSEAMQRAAGDLLAAKVALDRECADLAALGAAPSRAILIAATRVVDELKETDQALTLLLKEIEARTASA